MSNYETGHAVNVNNLLKLKTTTLIFGANYAPSNPLIQQAALDTLYTNAKTANDAVAPALANWKSKVGIRQGLMKPISKLTTRVMRALKASGASDETIAQAEEFSKKIKGRRSKNIETPPLGEDSNNVSASQFSVTQRIANFRNLIELLSTISSYDPGAEDLKLPALQTLITDMEVANKDTLTTEIILATVRKQRNQILYTEDTGLVDIAQTVKNVVASIFGFGSPEHKQVTKIKFTKGR